MRMHDKLDVHEKHIKGVPTMTLTPPHFTPTLPCPPLLDLKHIFRFELFNKL
jgi:hypothetical protein